mgnify:FL=1
MANNWMGNDAKDGKRKKHRVSIAMKRVPGEMRVEHTDKIVRCRVFLHDINPSGVGLFCESHVEVGAKVELVISVPKALYLKARIAWCGEAGTTTHIISNENFAFRAGLELSFDSKEAQEEFKVYCAQLVEMGS